jgi:Protein of unknown function (DUF2867)
MENMTPLISNTRNTRAVPLPANCQLAPTQHDADFADAYETLVPTSDLSATQIYCAVFGQTPGWVKALMWLRNRVVQPFGLKDAGAITNVPAARTAIAVPGQRIGLFEVVSVSANELVLQDDDKHLLVQLSVLKQSHDATHDKLTVSTVVHIHNTLGRVYMVFVGPAHKVIAPAVTRRASLAVATSLLQSSP